MFVEAFSHVIPFATGKGLTMSLLPHLLFAENASS